MTIEKENEIDTQELAERAGFIIDAGDSSERLIARFIMIGMDQGDLTPQQADQWLSHLEEDAA